MNNKLNHKTKNFTSLFLTLFLIVNLFAGIMPTAFAAAPAAIPSQIAFSIAGGAAEGNSAVGFNWVTDTSVTTSEIIYGTSPTLEDGTTKSATMTAPVATGSIPDNAMANFKAINSFKVTIQDLTPETKYYYKVGDSVSGYSAIASFTAPADPDENKPFSFVVSADTQGASESSFANTGALYDYIKANEPDAAFMIHTGDVVDDASKSDLYQYFFDSAQNLLSTLPIMASPGNHDGTSYDEFNVQFKARFNYSSLHKPDGLTTADGTIYSFEYGDALFICLNSYASSNDDAIQWQFLENECAATTKAWKIVYFHNAAYDPGSSHYQLDNVSGKKLTDAGVDLVFNGHEHAYARTT
jgi:predicted phosphodiesterase